MIIGYSGMPGSGKTTRLARTARACLIEARKHQEKYGVARKVLLNIRLTPLIEAEFAGLFEYYDDLESIHQVKDSYLLIDEASIYFNSREWELIPMSTRRFLVMHRHSNVDIWFTTQDFLTVDNSFRRLTDKLYYFRKIISTPEPSKYLKPKKRPFSFVHCKLVPKEHYDIEKTNYGSDGNSFYWFNMKDFNMFDTHQDFSVLEQTTPGYKDLKRVVRVCQQDGKKQIKYI
jgi:hypothetical protein